MRIASPNLQRWEFDLRELQVAEEKNTGGGERRVGRAARARAQRGAAPLR
jgi:hypothetical protein